MGDRPPAAPVGYRVSILPGALQALQHLPEDQSARLQAIIDGLTSNPRPATASEYLSKPGYWRARWRELRVVYRIDEPKSTVVVLWVGDYRGTAISRFLGLRER